MTITTFARWARRVRRVITPNHTIALACLVIAMLMTQVWPPGTLTFAAPNQAQEEPPLPEPGKIIVVMKPGTITSASTTARSSGGLVPTKTYGNVINGFAATASEDQIEALADDPNVAYIMPDVPIQAADQASTTSNSRTGVNQNPTAGIDKVNNPINVDIAIIDSGVNRHPDLNVAGGYNCVGTNTGAWGDVDGHGTHVAGIAGAIDNNIGMVGAAPGARIWSVRALSAGGGGNTSDLICALDWVAANSTIIDVVNMSLTGTFPASSTCSSGDALHAAVCNVVSLGIPVAAAAGNNNQDASTIIPAKYPEVIAVGAITDYNGQPGGGASRPSNCGEVALGNGADDQVAGYSNYGSVVDIVAPGTCIYSTLRSGGYGLMTGTSMATPSVAGALGLFKSQNPGSSSGAARNWLLSDKGSQTKTGSKGYTGGGINSRILYINQPVSGPSTTGMLTNPSFGGQKLPVSSSYGSSNGTGSARARDGSLGTSWYTINSNPTSGFFQFDLGQSRQLTGIKWNFRLADGADRMIVSTSNDGSNFEIVGVYSFGGVTGQWYGANANRSARYVRVSFENPNKRPVLGYVSELQVWGMTGGSLAYGVYSPRFGGKKLNIGRSFGSSNGSGSARAWDNNTATTWTTVNSNPTSGFFQLDLMSSKQISGIKWMFRVNGGADRMVVQTSNNGSTWSTVGTYKNPPNTQTWYGTYTNRNARYIRFSFTNPNGDPVLGYVSEVQIWGQPMTQTTIDPASATVAATPEASPMASPEASPVASPVASPEASPVASPEASPVASPEASPVVSSESTPEFRPEASPVASPEAPTPEAPSPTTEPTVAPPTGQVGTVTATGGEGLRCRTAPSTDADVITTLDEGATVEVTGPNTDGWVAVTCNGQPGFVAAEFLIIGDGTVPTEEATPPIESTTEAPTETETPEDIDPTAIPTEEVTLEPTEPTEEPTQEPVVQEPQPYQLVAVDDSENTGTGLAAVDDDSGTVWLISPSSSPDQARLWLDLGSVVPIDSVSWEMGYSNSLPTFEFWLSEDGSTWWNAARLDGTSLVPGEIYQQPLGYYARYVMIVIPDLEDSGYGQVGGFSQIDVWPAEDASGLSNLGAPTTPEPEPTEIPPTDVPATEEPPQEAPVTEEPPATDEPTTEPEQGGEKESPPDEPQPGNTIPESDDTPEPPG